MAPNLSATAWAALHENNSQKALEIIPHIDFSLDDIHHFRLLCCTYLQSQHWRALSAVASIAAERFPSEPIFWEIWAWAEHIQGNTQAALKILESLIPAFCHRESTACILAYLYAASQKYAEAARWSDFVHASLPTLAPSASQRWQPTNPTSPSNSCCPLQFHLILMVHCVSRFCIAYPPASAKTPARHDLLSHMGRSLVQTNPRRQSVRR